MTILDFTEIPAPTHHEKKSADLDAFEKFAEAFFKEIKGAKILKRCARGADGGIDLKIEYNGEKCLVSCKHKAHSGDSVSPKDEAPNLIDLLLAHKCTKFIGFYSTIASEKLRKSVEDTFRNSQSAKREGLTYEFFYNTDIESNILDINNPRGWIFSAKYFPKSYINLFQRIVVPIDYYNSSSKELSKLDGGYRLDGPCGGRFLGRPLEKILSDANECLTSELHQFFFYIAIKDAINLFPHYFVYSDQPIKDIDNLQINEISPAWNTDLDTSYSEKTINCNIPIIICAIWSLWDMEKACIKYSEYRKKSRNDTLYQDNYIHEIEIPYCGLNFALVAKLSNNRLRDLFARLVAFCPAGGAKTSLKLENSINFDPDKSGTTPEKWNLDLSEYNEWLKKGLSNR
ncbi:restriction endonuclease [Neisseria lisongii]|uniref:Restriction endonuclease type IV Mrr domain-containing protein n=1 Tax=Neisseria lisongii TaxID=2912188 RepID=A0AAW5ANU0_9NEIS|nr:restriction endonuclease [Neisseria lisongii]MCF7529477.1 hypothetical protein [Neisseria lisongii]MCF7530184.1 hypothetical protein [Neisseria lisongii]